MKILGYVLMIPMAFITLSIFAISYMAARLKGKKELYLWKQSVSGCAALLEEYGRGGRQR